MIQMGLWNGKRCESKEMTEEEKLEFEDLLKPFRESSSSE